MAKTKGLNLSSIEAAGMTLKQRAVHYYWGDNAGHPAFRHAMTIHRVRTSANRSTILPSQPSKVMPEQHGLLNHLQRAAKPRTARVLMEKHPLFNEAIEAIVAAVVNGESNFFDVFADATRRFKEWSPANAVRYEAARYVLECEARGTIATRESTIARVKKRLGDDKGGIESAIDRMRLFQKTGLVQTAGSPHRKTSPAQK